MKKLLAIFASCLLAGCTSTTYVVRNCIEQQNATLFSAKYSYFQGTRNYKINVNEDKSVKVNITTSKGTLNVKVYDSSTSFYEGNIDSDFSFTLNLNKGKYKVSLTTKEHSGSYSFSW